MNWRQFLTPVQSIDTDQAKSYLADKQVDELTILDVRQPKEYEAGHIPGAVLAPLPELTDHMDRARLIAVTGYFSAAVVFINALAPSWEWVAVARLRSRIEGQRLRPVSL